jgi:hypothetical protein
MPPRVYTEFDWAAVDHVNIASAPFLTDAELNLLTAAVAVISTGKVDVASLPSTAIAGDVTGTIGTSTVVRIQGRPVASSAPDSGQALVWNGTTWAPATVAAEGEGGSQSADLLLIESTKTAVAVATNKVGIYRKQLPGGNYAMILNVGGQEIGYVDTNGLSLYVGTLQLFLAELQANIAAYDGAQAAPSVTFDDDRTLGFYRSQIGGIYSMAFADDNTTPWWYNRLGLFVADGDKLRQDARLRANSRDVQRTETFTTGWIAGLPGQWLTAGSDMVYGSITNGDAVIGTNGSCVLRATYPLAGYAITAALTNTTLVVSGYNAGVWELIGSAATESLTNRTYTRLKIEADPDTIPGIGGTPTYAAVLNSVVLHRWAYTSQVDVAQDTAGMHLRADDPIADRDVANKRYADSVGAAAAASAAAAWSTQPATTDVNLAGHRLFLDSKWALVGSGAWNALSYDGSVSAGVETNEMRFEINGAVVWSATLGYSLAHINSLTMSAGGTNVTMLVATNGVSSDPWPEYATAVTGPWAPVPSYTEGWTLGMATNQFSVAFVNPIVGSGSGFFRVCYTTPGAVEQATFYVPTQAPRFLFPAGDYLIGTGSNLYYVTSGGVSNALYP